MPQPTTRNFGLPFPAVRGPDQREQERRWEAHVAAGRIGSSDVAPGGEQDFLARMAEMERAVLGEMRSVSRVGPEGR